MDYKVVVREVVKLQNFLDNRGWFVSEEFSSVFENVQREIERLQKKATRDLLSKLERYEEESALWASGKMTDPNGEPISISKREQQKSGTELKRIKSVIAKIKQAR